jgi:large subunit ribosomal protein L10
MRPEKESILREINDDLKKAKYVILTDYRGLKAEQLTALRAQMRGGKACFKVVKNSLLGNAARELGYGDIATFLQGPTAMITGDGDITASAKLLKAYIEENKLPVVKGGVFDGKIITAAIVDEMASLPAREILLGMMVGTVAAPMSRLVGAMSQKLSSLLYVLKAIEEKKTSGK